MASLVLGLLIVGMGALIYFRVRKIAGNDLQHLDGKLNAIHKNLGALHEEVQAVSGMLKTHLADHKAGRVHRRRGE